MATTAGMAAGGAAMGLALGSFADNSSPIQQAYVAKMLLPVNNENKIHIYADKIYIGLNRLPGNGSINTELRNNLFQNHSYEFYWSDLKRFLP